MKKNILILLIFNLILISVFAGGGGYYDDEFPNYSFVMLNKKLYTESERVQFIINPCEAELKSGQKIALPVGTKVSINDVEINLKINHDYDYKNGWDDSNYGIMYPDYICSFSLNGKKYRGKIPGINISTNSSVCSDGNGNNFILMELWGAKNFFNSDIRLCDSYEEVKDFITNEMNDYLKIEVASLRQSSQKLFARKIYSTSSKESFDVDIYYGKDCDYEYPEGFGELIFAENLDVPIPILELESYNGGMGGGLFRFSWLALNPKNGKTNFITQHSYLSTDSGYFGKCDFSIQNGQIKLYVYQDDEYGEVMEDTYYVYCQSEDDPFNFYFTLYAD